MADDENVWQAQFKVDKSLRAKLLHIQDKCDLKTYSQALTALVLFEEKNGLGKLAKFVFLNKKAIIEASY